MKSGEHGFRHLATATTYSLKGLASAWRHETAFRQEVVVVVILLPLAFVVARDVTQWLLLALPLLLLLVVELLNSAIECAVDRVGDEIHALSGRAKDLGSAAVMVSLLLAAVAWGAVLWLNYGPGGSPAPAAVVASPETDLTASCKIEAPDAAVACTMEWDPVCGCDGTTYSNACSARAAGVPRYEQGACEKGDLD